VAVREGHLLTVRADGVDHTCGLLGIDAPELSHEGLQREMDRVTRFAPPHGQAELRAAQEVFRRWTAVAEQRATEAQAGLAALAMDRDVELTYAAAGRTRDPDGRLLAYVSVGGTDLGAEMLRRGLAVSDGPFAPDRFEQYAAICSRAQFTRVGIWAGPPGSGGAQVAAAFLPVGPEHWKAMYNVQYRIGERHGWRLAQTAGDRSAHLVNAHNATALWLHDAMLEGDFEVTLSAFATEGVSVTLRQGEALKNGVHVPVPAGEECHIGLRRLGGTMQAALNGQPVVLQELRYGGEPAGSGRFGISLAKGAELQVWDVSIRSADSTPVPPGAADGAPQG
jgi:endonuclease YncB( thermonuclease family)